MKYVWRRKIYPRNILFICGKSYLKTACCYIIPMCLVKKFLVLGCVGVTAPFYGFGRLGIEVNINYSLHLDTLLRNLFSNRRRSFTQSGHSIREYHNIRVAQLNFISAVITIHVKGYRNSFIAQLSC